MTTEQEPLNLYRDEVDDEEAAKKKKILLIIIIVAVVLVLLLTGVLVWWFFIRSPPFNPHRMEQELGPSGTFEGFNILPEHKVDNIYDAPAPSHWLRDEMICHIDEMGLGEDFIGFGVDKVDTTEKSILARYGPDMVRKNILFEDTIFKSDLMGCEWLLGKYLVIIHKSGNSWTYADSFEFTDDTKTALTKKTTTSLQVGEATDMVKMSDSRVYLSSGSNKKDPHRLMDIN